MNKGELIETLAQANEIPVSQSRAYLESLLELIESVIASSLYASNLYFWRETTGYFGATSDELPLLHNWSLSVEEHFSPGSTHVEPSGDGPTEASSCKLASRAPPSLVPSTPVVPATPDEHPTRVRAQTDTKRIVRRRCMISSEAPRHVEASKAVMGVGTTFDHSSCNKSHARPSLRRQTCAQSDTLGAVWARRR